MTAIHIIIAEQLRALLVAIESDHASLADAEAQQRVGWLLQLAQQLAYDLVDQLKAEAPHA